MINKEIFDIPNDYYFKLGYKKENSDLDTKISYRRIFSKNLEERNQFKLPFSNKEFEIITQKLSEKNYFLMKKILGSNNEEFIFNSPFKTEHLIRGKTQTEKNIFSLFENIRDGSKYAFMIKNNTMIPDNTNKKNKTNLHDEISEAIIQKLSKGTFKYLIRVYNLNIFNQHIERLKRANSLFSKDQINESLKENIFRSNKIIYFTLYTFIIFNVFLGKSIFNNLSSQKTKKENENISNEIFDFEKLNELVSTIPKSMEFLTQYEDLSNKLTLRRDVVVRVYILRLEEIANRDEIDEGDNGQSDPFVKVYLENDDEGNLVLGSEKDYKENVRNCAWAKHYE
jgi:hypothetical protein